MFLAREASGGYDFITFGGYPNESPDELDRHSAPHTARVLSRVSPRHHARDLAQRPPPPSVAQPDLVIDPVHLDFGVVWATQRFDWRLPVTNRSEGEVVLEQLKGDCSCLSIGELPLRFRPGETKEIHVVIDLDRLAGQAGEEKPHRVILTGLVAAGGLQTAVRWEITGRMKAALQANPNSLHLGLQSARQRFIERKLTVEAAEGVTELWAEDFGSWQVKTQRESVSPSRFIVMVRSRDQLRLGRMDQ
jgi:hypothetical protein